MPLAAELAARVEVDTGAEIHEIYGSTEAGCVATRHTTRGLTWRLASDLTLVVGPDGVATLHGERVGGALELRDRVAQVDGGFELCGRDTDLVKIAGKRASLQALTAILRDIDGVDDGAFIDGASIGQKRLVAFAVAPQLSSERIRASLALRIDAAFLPRPLVLLDELPRDVNGKVRLDALAELVASAKRRPTSFVTEGLHSHAG
jgi:acyl-coenzyme A synthetase/AMP-(fatty) acid ligase